MSETFSTLWKTKKPSAKSGDSRIMSTGFLVRIKEAVVGEKYDLSLVFSDNKESKKLNKIYRNKSYTPNVLSFSIDKKSGEIFINPLVAKKEASLFERTYPEHVVCLFIHGLYHLKGYRHGSTMERAELKIRKKFGIS